MTPVSICVGASSHLVRIVETMPTFTREEIIHLGDLARIALTDEEITRMQSELNVIAESINSVQEVATDDVVPTANPVPLEAYLRPDVPVKPLDQSEVLAAAPATEDGMFVARVGTGVGKWRELVDANKLTYPVYDYAGLVDEPSNGGGLPHMYVVNHRGKVVYSGRNHDECVAAVQAAIQAVGAMPTLCGGVSLQAFKSMEKQLVLGKPIKSQVKALQNAVKKGESKSATAVQQKQAEEAKEILAAIDESKTDIKDEIEEKKSTNPEEALKLVKAYIATFPAEGAAYKAELPELSAKAAEWKKAQKAAK